MARCLALSDLQGCLQVNLPEVENVILLGWPGVVQQIFMTHSHTIGPIADSEKELRNDVSDRPLRKFCQILSFTNCCLLQLKMNSSVVLPPEG